MELEHKSIAFEVKGVSDEGPGSFEGLGSAYFNIDGVGDIVSPGAFRDAIPKFLSEGFIGGLNHKWDAPIGHPVEARETPDGLYVKAALDDTPDARAVRAMMRINPASGRATVRKLSIGYRVPEGGARMLAGAEEVKSYWKAAGYQPSAADLADAARWPKVRLLHKLELHEISPVSVPANTRATVTGAKGIGDGPEQRPSFDAQSRDVASAIGEALEAFRGRAESRMRARVKAGRVLSSANRSAIEAVCSALESGVAELRSILDRTMPGDAGKSEAAEEVKAGETVQAVAEVPPAAAGPITPPPPATPMPDPGPPPAPTRVDPAVVRGLFTRYVDDTLRAAPTAVPIGENPCPTS